MKIAFWFNLVALFGCAFWWYQTRDTEPVVAFFVGCGTLAAGWGYVSKTNKIVVQGNGNSIRQSISDSDKTSSINEVDVKGDKSNIEQNL